MAQSLDNQITQRPRYLRILVLSGLAILLVWLIVTRSLAASLAESSPEAALTLQPQQPRALMTLARTELKPLLKQWEQDATQDTKGGAPEGLDRLSALSKLAEGAMGSRDRAAIQQPENAPATSAESEKPSDPSKPVDLSEQARRVQMLAERTIAADPLNADALTILGQLSERSDDAVRTSALMQAAMRLSIRQSYPVFWMMQKSQKDNDDIAALRHADTLLRTRSKAAPLVVPVIAKIAEKKEF